MGLTGFLFLILFFVVVVGTQKVPDKRRCILLYVLMSYVFYAMSSLRYIFLLAGMTTASYFFARLLLKSPEHGARSRCVFFAAVFITALPLGIFKYAAFFFRALNSLLNYISIDFSLTIPQTELPPGISFYTFIMLGYLFDAYRRRGFPAKSFIDFSFLTSFFPYLLSGPIVRSSDILPQAETFKPLERTMALKGMELMLVGYFKKCVIADNCTAYIDPVFSDPGSYGGLCVWIATFFFTLQIYCDFSGYTDIARGVGKILGFNLPINFRWPYFSHSVQEFWRRWHMTLSFWIRDYIYFPLGGSRVPTLRYLYNMLFTWFLCGLWHGAQYRYVLWGLYNGAFVALEFFMRRLGAGAGKFRIPQFIKVGITFLVVMVGWMLFRSNSVTSAFFMAKTMFNPFAENVFEGIHIFSGLPLISLIALPLVHFITYRFHYDIDSVSVLDKIPYALRLCAVVFAVFIIVLYSGAKTPFIYSGF